MWGGVPQNENIFQLVFSVSNSIEANSNILSRITFMKWSAISMKNNGYLLLKEQMNT